MKRDKHHFMIVGLLFAAFFMGFQEVRGQFFNQDFDISATLADYANSTSPNPHQFDHINSQANINASINSNRLRFVRSGNGGSGSAIRMTDIGTGYNAVMIRFDISTFTATASSHELLMEVQLGTDYTNVNNPEGGNKVFAEIGINLGSANSNFRITHTSLSSSDMSTVNRAAGTANRITFAANRSGNDVVYGAPNGSLRTLATGQMEIWTGTNLEFGGAVAIPTGTLQATTVTDLKFVCPAVNRNFTIDIDDISFFPLGPMPAQNYEVGRSTTVAATTYPFTSITRNGGGFFEVLNFRGAIAGAMNFQVMTDITVENGVNALNQLTGMSAANPIEIQPDGTTMRTIRTNAYSGPSNQGLINSSC